MKTLDSLLQFALLALAAASFVMTPNPPESPDSSIIDKIAARSPLCDCDDCKCVSPCLCNVVDQEPLVVGPPPDRVLDISNAKIVPVALVDHPERFTEPERPQPKPVPVVKASAPTGRWVTQYAGFRGRRSYQVWVPDQPAASCANGSCANGSCSVAPAACANGSCQVQGYSSGGCASCGRGRR